jgi:hypothetical protein
VVKKMTKGVYSPVTALVTTESTFFLLQEERDHGNTEKSYRRSMAELQGYFFAVF